MAVESAPVEYDRLKRVVSQLISTNQDVEFFRSQTWTVKLLNTEDINAMVVPVSMLIIHSLLHEHIFSAVSFPV